MSTNHTPNYNLNQWEKTDKVLMEEFNADNAKIDAALKAEADVRAAAVAGLSGQLSALAQKGNCQIYTTSYVGKGTYGENNQNSLTFPAKPMVVFLCGPDGLRGMLIQGQDKGFCSVLTGGSGLFFITWSGNTVQWYNHISPGSQMNNANTTYLVVALLAL